MWIIETIKGHTVHNVIGMDYVNIGKPNIFIVDLDIWRLIVIVRCFIVAASCVTDEAAALCTPLSFNLDEGPHVGWAWVAFVTDHLDFILIKKAGGEVNLAYVYVIRHVLAERVGSVISFGENIIDLTVHALI